MLSSARSGRHPLEEASTLPSRRFLTHPVTPSLIAASRVNARKQTPWTMPLILTRTRLFSISASATQALLKHHVRADPGIHFQYKPLPPSIIICWPLPCPVLLRPSTGMRLRTGINQSKPLLLVRTFRPSSLAFFSLEPAPGPATTYPCFGYRPGHIGTKLQPGPWPHFGSFSPIFR